MADAPSRPADRFFAKLGPALQAVAEGKAGNQAGSEAARALDELQAQLDKLVIRFYHV